MSNSVTTISTCPRICRHRISYTLVYHINLIKYTIVPDAVVGGVLAMCGKRDRTPGYVASLDIHKIH